MLESQKIEMRIREVETGIASFDVDSGNGDDLTALAEKRELLVKQLEMVKGMEAKDDAEKEKDRVENSVPSDDAEEREWQALFAPVEARHFLHAVANQGLDRLDGEAGEWRKALWPNGEGSHYMPLEALLTPEERANTSFATIQRNQNNIGARVFGRSDSEYLGIRTETVGVGEATYSYLSAGVAPDAVNQHADVDQTAATIATITLAPIRIGAQYLFGTESLHSVRGMESVLTADMRASLTDKRDSFNLNGKTADPAIQGLLGNLTPPDDPTVVVTVAAFRAAIWAAVDAKLAYRDTAAGGAPAVRCLINLETVRLLASLSLGTATGEYLTDRYDDSVLRASARMPDTDSDIAAYILHKPAGVGRVVSPVWRGIEFITDRISKARQGQIAITAQLLTNIDAVRTDAHSRGKFKVS